ncbi:DUF962 domain-containing protein [Dongia soli]|uniref:DUF962 domain-containing protein n=1 Tax=Dongia soli TaxID=600628 RepID=A0ABU5ECV9_9PROT|nr:DUF962 domain-containing protein [Dongia soli]MDY0884200.1 DUF962 domain-containing protein [Dongia soli]
MQFSEFWRLYLDAHRKPATRLCHYLATTIGIVTSIVSALFDELLVLAGGMSCAIALAIGSHRLIEGNKPLIAINPFYGALADVRMCWLALTGGLQREYLRLGLVSVPQATNSLAKQTTV